MQALRQSERATSILAISTRIVTRANFLQPLMITYNGDSLSGGFISVEYETTNQNDVNEDGDNGVNVGTNTLSVQLDVDDDGSRGIKSSNNLIAGRLGISPDDCMDLDLEVKQSVLEIIATACERNRCVTRIWFYNLICLPHAPRAMMSPESSRTARPLSTGVAWANKPKATRKRKKE